MRFIEALFKCRVAQVYRGRIDDKKTKSFSREVINITLTYCTGGFLIAVITAAVIAPRVMQCTEEVLCTRDLCVSTT